MGKAFRDVRVWNVRVWNVQVWGLHVRGLAHNPEFCQLFGQYAFPEHAPTTGYAPSVMMPMAVPHCMMIPPAGHACPARFFSACKDSGMHRSEGGTSCEGMLCRT
eukprot:CAMPEP_0206149550 /NCGR_PEP_ID=MMETSP1473-20131121/37843_1 /ASSEMBLY_ACC=CAM_ASM_001109 /TAXON_ID=1461547 /ORGANISM="Stichococcus sp, Strain RCC1054" /LENGTH=104 /DNA_ID=CAMNT_0053547025 /DNA_START=459 /DNA_END=773 /DNA_ORIENTATION=-